jgi:hypothetical protein
MHPRFHIGGETAGFAQGAEASQGRSEDVTSSALAV